MSNKDIEHWLLSKGVFMDCRKCTDSKKGCYKNCKFYQSYKKGNKMSRDNQIEEMAEIILDVDRSYYGMECDEIQAKAEAAAIYDKGYRKIYDDHQRQCTCYALGCQMAEQLKKEVAREVIEEVATLLEDNWNDIQHGSYWLTNGRCIPLRELLNTVEKKYAEGEG